jgi:hypothetical protein
VTIDPASWLGAGESGRAWALNENTVPSTPQTKIEAIFFDIGGSSFFCLQSAAPLAALPMRDWAKESLPAMQIRQWTPQIDV